MDPLTQVVDFSAAVFSPLDIFVNMCIAGVLGIWLSGIYIKTHKGLSYSQSFMLTIIFVSIIVAMVMMVIGNSLARAFALVGALSIIRFRTVVKDTKDTAYIFIALAVGMAAGTANYMLALVGTLVFSIFSLGLHLTNYGALLTSEFILRFRVDSRASEAYLSILRKYSKNPSLLQSEPSADDHKTILCTFDIVMRKNMSTDRFIEELADISGVSEVALIASKTDVDY